MFSIVEKCQEHTKGQTFYMIISKHIWYVTSLTKSHNGFHQTKPKMFSILSGPLSQNRFEFLLMDQSPTKICLIYLKIVKFIVLHCDALSSWKENKKMWGPSFDTFHQNIKNLITVSSSQWGYTRYSLRKQQCVLFRHRILPGP